MNHEMHEKHEKFLYKEECYRLQRAVFDVYKKWVVDFLNLSTKNALRENCIGGRFLLSQRKNLGFFTRMSH